ncbi:MAG TPA: hypothetical protein VFP61_00405 [Acidimicrobiales bacterium]|nr:hypothetical protein [Acidimicrobiales bacterium]
MAGTLTIAEAAERAALSREDIVLLMHRGDVRAVPDDAGLPVVDADSLEAWISAQVG